MTKKKSEWIDISLPIHTGRIVWPGDPEVQVSKLLQIEKGDICNTSHITTPVHVGTHVDAPLHFIDGGDGIEKLPISSLAGKAKVIEIKNEKEVPLEEIQNSGIVEGDIVLFKTINSTGYLKEEQFNEDYVYLSTKAAEFLVSRKISTVGIDYYSIAGVNSNLIECHQVLLGAGVTIVEGLDLSAISPGIYDFVCLPLKIVGSDGAPARAIIRKTDELI
ncbi:MAG: cyclase family protein [Thermodesulfobacteriota bacterium]